MDNSTKEQFLILVDTEQYISISMANEDGVLLPSAYLRMVSTVSEQALNALDCDVPEMIRNHGLSWIMLAFSIRQFSAPSPNETVRIRCWNGKKSGPIYRMEFEILHSDGSIAAEACIFLAVFDISTRRICIREVIPDLPEGPELFSADSRCSFDESLFVPAGASVVPPSWLDRLGHVNNTHYGDLSYDCLSETARKSLNDLTGFDLFFLSELRLGCKVSVFRRDTAESSEILGKHAENGTPAFLMRFRYGSE